MTAIKESPFSASFTLSRCHTTSTKPGNSEKLRMLLDKIEGLTTIHSALGTCLYVHVTFQLLGQDKLPPGILSEITKIFQETFPEDKLLNSSNQQAFIPSSNLEDARIKSQQVYLNYRKWCIDTAFREAPEYLLRDYSFTEEELYLLNHLLANLSDKYREKWVGRSFDLNFKSRSLKVIHYVLGVSSSL